MTDSTASVHATRAAPRRVATALTAARAADALARDRIAIAMDELLAAAPVMRTIGTRLLMRPVSRGARCTAEAIARELRIPERTLGSRIYRAGGASIRRFRGEIILTRLAAIVEPEHVAWRAHRRGARIGNGPGRCLLAGAAA